MKCYLYILKSLRDRKYYIGITENIKKRIISHNQGKTRSTKSRRPFVLVYTEKHSDRKEARNREKFLKSYKGVTEKRKIIGQFDSAGE